MNDKFKCCKCGMHNRCHKICMDCDHNKCDKCEIYITKGREAFPSTVACMKLMKSINKETKQFIKDSEMNG